MARLVGLDIGSTTIKVVELEQNGRNSKLTAVGLSAAPPKGLSSEASFDQLALSDAIKKTCADAKISVKTVNVALPESLIFTRVIEMPVLSEKELASAIRWEAEQYVPLPLSKVILDYQVMQSMQGTGGRMHVFLVAAPKTLVAKYQKVIADAGLILSSIETEVAALNRALVTDSATVPVTLVVSIGAERTNVFVSKGANILLAYVIPTGGKALTRAIAADLNIDPTQAEEYKKTYGLEKDVLSGKIGNTVKPVLDNLTMELKRAMSFYQTKNVQAEPIRLVVLVGGSAKLPGLVVYLAGNLGVEMQIGDPWQKVSDRQKLTNLPYDPIIFTQAVGLALKPI